MGRRSSYGSRSWGYYPDEASDSWGNGHWDDWGNDDEWDEEEDDDEFDEDVDASSRRYYYYWEPTTPIRTESGIKLKSKRGQVGENWWTRRWLETLEGMEIGSRLARGRSYARQGQILSLSIQAGRVEARVQGSTPRPYKVIIKLAPLIDMDWERILDALASDAFLSARLLAGEMPREIDELFTRERITLFPEDIDDLQTRCSCPDHANPCKHISAVYYILAERLDSDPFLLFALRGRDRDAISEALRQKRSTALDDTASPLVANEPPPTPPTQPLSERVLDFWQAGAEIENFALRPVEAESQQAILRELGESPYMLDGENLTAWLGRMYNNAALYAQQRLDKAP